jgi:transcriptional regulator with AAA-type ATPase domain
VRNNTAILQQIQQDQVRKQSQFRHASDSLELLQNADAAIMNAKKQSLMKQLVQYEEMIDQYQLAINTNAPVLLTVESARASLWHDRPRTWQNILFSIAAAFALTFLMALFIESRKYNN